MDRSATDPDTLAVAKPLLAHHPRRSTDENVVIAGADVHSNRPITAFCRTGFSQFSEGKVAGTMTARQQKSAEMIIVEGDALAFHMIQDPISGPVSPTLGAKTMGMGVIALNPHAGPNARGAGMTEDVAPPIKGNDGGNAIPAVFAFKPSHFTRGKDGGPSAVFPPLTADADKGDQDPVCFDGIRPRRLMPVECERLMDWPDNWTNVPDERGKSPADSPRYRGAGNGVASCCAEWIGWQIRHALGV